MERGPSHAEQQQWYGYGMGPRLEPWQHELIRGRCARNFGTGRLRTRRLGGRQGRGGKDLPCGSGLFARPSCHHAKTGG